MQQGRVKIFRLPDHLIPEQIMCLAVPMKIISIDGTEAVVEAAGVRKSARLDLLPEASIGDYVLLHAGLAISRVDEYEAKETLAMFEQFIDE